MLPLYPKRGLTQRAPDPRQPRHRATGAGCAGVMMVGVAAFFRQFAWLGAGSVKVALSRPTPSG